MIDSISTLNSPTIYESAIVALWLTLPIVIGGVAHMFFVANDWLPSLKVPINEALFGKNKTWRGVVVMPLVTVPGALLLGALSGVQPDSLSSSLSEVPLVLLGLCLGLGYVILELPNSYLKRKLGIPPGATPEQGTYWFIALDQLDSAIGFTIVYALFFDFPAVTYLLLLIEFPFVALVVKRVLYWVRLKKSYL